MHWCLAFGQSPLRFQNNMFERMFSKCDASVGFAIRRHFFKKFRCLRRSGFFDSAFQCFGDFGGVRSLLMYQGPLGAHSWEPTPPVPNGTLGTPGLDYFEKVQFHHFEGSPFGRFSSEEIEKGSRFKRHLRLETRNKMKPPRNLRQKDCLKWFDSLPIKSRMSFKPVFTILTSLKTVSR